MTTRLPAPVRRSPLEAVHARLGARWRSDTERWPSSYGDEAGEARVVEEGIALAEPGPYEKVVVRGPSTLVDLRWLGLAARPGFLEPARTLDGVNAWVTADDEAYLLRLAGVGAAPGRAPTVATESLDEIAAKLRSAGPSVVEVSSAYTILRLVGRRLPALMQELCSVDTSVRAVPDLAIVQAPVVGLRMVTARRDHGEIPGWIFLVGRDDAEFAWDAIVGLGASYGVRPVGMAAVRPPALPDTAPVAAGGGR
jgi:glycine cleavage system aminomethyltransferase T